MPKVLLLADFSEEYFKRILLGIARYAKENGTWVFCRMPIHYREKLGLKGIVDWAHQWGADGMFAQLSVDDDTPFLSQIGFPIVVPDLKERFRNTSNISGNYYRTGQIAAEYFLKRGHRNFGFYGYPDYVWSRERGDGFAEFLNKKGHIVSFFQLENNPKHEMWFYQPSALSKWLESLPKPVAIMACDDNCGQQLSEACKLLGLKVPEEVAVLGVDNDELICNLSDPPLSSIELDCEKGGYEAARLMEELIVTGTKKMRDVIIEPVKIITRTSTDTYATANKHIANALKIIHQNYLQPISVFDILKHIPLSRRTFELHFKAETGKPVYQYIIELRMDYISKQLIETDRPINEIALNAGFPEVKNLSRSFNKYFQCTPLEYRKRNFSTFNQL